MPRILVAEDDFDHAEFVRRALAAHGHEVIVVHDGAEAVRALALGNLDLVLADIRMPIVDGVALALKVVKEHPDVRVLLMSGFGDEIERAQNLRVLISDLVAKPFTADEINAAVERVLAGGP